MGIAITFPTWLAWTCSICWLICLVGAATFMILVMVLALQDNFPKWREDKQGSFYFLLGLLLGIEHTFFGWWIYLRFLK